MQCVNLISLPHGLSLNLLEIYFKCLISPVVTGMYYICLQCKWTSHRVLHSLLGPVIMILTWGYVVYLVSTSVLSGFSFSNWQVYNLITDQTYGCHTFQGYELNAMTCVFRPGKLTQIHVIDVNWLLNV